MSTILPGLCSVILRAESVDSVARLAGECGVRAIEWGADVHVPPGDSGAASLARAATAAADCRVASYGTYLFAAGVPAPNDTCAVLDTAVALGAPNVRVWATFGVEPGSSAYPELVDGLRACCVEGGARDLTVGLEFHGSTATATVDGVLALLAAVDRPELFTYWQPPYWRGPTTPESDAREVVALGDHLSHLHGYEWASAEKRLPLAAGADRWRAVLAAAANPLTGNGDGAWPGDRVAFLEFVAGDDPAALRRDAAVLHDWLDELS